MECGRLIPGVGLSLTDAPARSATSDRELSIFTRDGLEALAIDRERGLCFDRYEADVVVDGIGLGDVPAGAILRLGTALVELTRVRKRCFAACRRPDRSSCPLRASARFARVVRSGVVRIEESDGA